MPDNYVSPESVEFSHNTSERQADWQVIMLINGPTGSSALLEELHQSLSMETAIE